MNLYFTIKTSLPDYLQASRATSQVASRAASQANNSFQNQSLPATTPPIEIDEVLNSQSNGDQSICFTSSGLVYCDERTVCEMISVKKDVATLVRERNSSRVVNSCHVCVCSKSSIPLIEAHLPSLLNCPILCATPVGRSWKVKIPKMFI